MGACVLTGVVCGFGVPIVSRLFGLHAFSLVLLPLTALLAGAVLGGSLRPAPRTAGGAFLAGALLWALIGVGGGLLWPIKVLLGAVVAVVAAGAFATAVAWRQPARRALPRG
jgi:hypothetical protein